MKTTQEHDKRIANMTFASVYPHYITKVVSKGRTKKELHQVIEWLTGFDEKKLQKLIEEKATFKTFFQKARLNPNAHLITGVICGYIADKKDLKKFLSRQTKQMTTRLIFTERPNRLMKKM